MKSGVPLFSSLLVASAAALPSYNGSWSGYEHPHASGTGAARPTGWWQGHGDGGAYGGKGGNGGYPGDKAMSSGASPASSKQSTSTDYTTIETTTIEYNTETVTASPSSAASSTGGNAPSWYGDYKSSGSSTSSSNADYISQLESELSSLKSELQSASQAPQTCTAPATGNTMGASTPAAYASSSAAAYNSASTEDYYSSPSASGDVTSTYIEAYTTTLTTTIRYPGSTTVTNSYTTTLPYNPFYPYPNAPTTSYASSSGSPSASGSASKGAYSSGAPFGSNGTSSMPYGTASGTGMIGTGTGMVGTGTATLPKSTAPAKITNGTDCASLCSSMTTFNGWDVTVETCTQLEAGVAVDTAEGESSVGCATTFTPEVDLCQVTLNVATAGNAEMYMEVWLPNADASAWNGRSMNTDNGGLNGCVHYVDMQYVTGMGFAAIGDNAGHNGSSFDASWTYENNEGIIDWSYRARHAAVEVGKQVIDEFYGKKADKSYYIGCSTGGAQGMQSAQMYPGDFDGIIAGASAADFNHLQDWSARFIQITGYSGNDTFLTEDEWILVQSYILDQCDAAIDGVDDGILEDPTICDFDATAIPICNDTSANGTCLTATQLNTVEEIFTPLYDVAGNLLYPALLHGSQVDAYRLGQLSGTIQGIAEGWFQGGVYNDTSFDVTTVDQSSYAKADAEDELHGYVSAFNGDLSGFQSAGGKMMMYHGMADPLTSGSNSQRYYVKVANTMGLEPTAIDEFYRLFRISGMAHCGVGGISGAGAWMFGQSEAAANATNNIVVDLVNWVEKSDAPETLLGTKFNYDESSLGIEFERAHCRFPYRTTYSGSGDSNDPASWGCTFIDDWKTYMPF